MNIAFLWNWPVNEFTGGVGVVTKVLAKEMQNRGHRVIFIALVTQEEKSRNARLLESLGMNQDTYPYVAPQYYVDAGMELELVVTETTEILEQNKIDMVIAQDLDPLEIDIVSKLPDRYVKIITKHSQPFEAYEFTRNVFKGYQAKTLSKKIWKNVVLACPYLGQMRQKQLNERLYKKATSSADRLCLLSSGFVIRLLRFMPDLDQRKICYVNNPNTFSTNVEDVHHKENLVIIVCRLVESMKNVTDFMKAWKMVEQYHPDWKAEVVGDGRDMQMLKKQCKKMNLHSLTFVGYHSDVESFYKRAKIICVTSWYEGWGMTITEGMANGCVPIVYDTYEAIRDIFDDEVSGLTIKSCKPQELFEKLNNLMNDSTQLNLLSNNAIEKVKQFSPDKIVENWEKLYKEIKEEKHV